MEKGFRLLLVETCSCRWRVLKFSTCALLEHKDWQQGSGFEVQASDVADAEDREGPQKLHSRVRGCVQAPSWSSSY